jgi:hypothetical protein
MIQKSAVTIRDGKTAQIIPLLLALYENHL